MKKLLFSTLLIVLSIFSLSITQAHAQVNRVKVEPMGKTKDADKMADGWKKGGEGILNLSSTTFSNWANGGTNATNLIGNVALFADYKAGKMLWENDARIALGFLSNSSDIKTILDKDYVQKAEDRFEIDSKLGHELKADKLYWSTLLQIRTQLFDGKNYKGGKYANLLTPEAGDSIIPQYTSRSFSPLVLMFGTGLDYKPTTKLSIYFSPVTYKGIFVGKQDIANLGIYGNVAGKTSKHEVGAFLRATYTEPHFFTENLSLTSNLELYSNYLENIYGEHKPQNIDVEWINTFGLKVSKYISAKFEHGLRYDDEVKVTKKVKDSETLTYQGKGLQTRTFLGIGFTYKF